MFIDLLAAYETVWHDGLLLKLARIISCKKMLRLLSTMIGTRRFFLCMADQKSKTRKLKNGVPQGSVLVSTLFNTYLKDMLITEAKKFEYANDWEIACQSQNFKTIEKKLKRDVNVIQDYFT